MNSNIIYKLYLKTHLKTGLRYLGYTTKVGAAFKNYTGSGDRWLRHINKHGYNVKTEILLKTKDSSELKEKGLYYSKLWNIVEDRSFANNIPEEGTGGATTKNKIAITDGHDTKYISRDEEIPAGWRSGGGPKYGQTKGKISITDGKNNRYILPEEDIPEGWTLGNISGKNTKYITDGNNVRRVPKDSEVPHGWKITYPAEGRFAITDGESVKWLAEGCKIPEGWTIGYSSKMKEKMSAKKKGKIWISDGTSIKMLDPSEPIPDGWHRGRK
jgi:uncharacterized protein YbdZ (MbtH family)